MLPKHLFGYDAIHAKALSDKGMLVECICGENLTFQSVQLGLLSHELNPVSVACKSCGHVNDFSIDQLRRPSVGLTNRPAFLHVVPD